MKFLFVCSVSPLNEFRIPELDSIAALFGFPISYPEGVDITVRISSSIHTCCVVA